MTRSRTILAGSFTVFMLLTLGAVCGSPVRDTEVAPVGSATGTPAMASPAAAANPACVPASALPASLAGLATATDCATGSAVLGDGTAVAGTLDGNLVVSGKAGMQTFPSQGTGPVTALAAFGTFGDVTYAVDEGIGIFNPHVGKNVSFAGHALTDKANHAVQADQYLAAGRFVLMAPQAGRPHLNALGQYALTKADGQDEVVIVGASVCATYIAAPGALPEQAWCADVLAQLVAPEAAPTAVAPPPVLPATGDGACAVPAGVTFDSAHTIDIVLRRDTITPSAITVRAGERYLFSVSTPDPHWAHSLSLLNGQGRVILDGGIPVLCLPSPSQAHPEPTTGSFVAPQEGGVMYLADLLGTSGRITVTDELPAEPAATGSPVDLAALTPSVAPTATATFIQPNVGNGRATQTPAPGATPAPQ